MNDGGCDPQGRFYCGTMAYAETPGAGTLYRLDPDGGVSVTLRDVTISNGLQWNRAGDTVFYADTPTGRVDRFDFDPASGAFTDRRTFTEISGGGYPDGMAIDEEDGIWVALWGGSAVHRYDRAGRLDLVVDLPVSNVTACAFGGPELRTLYITTSRAGPRPGRPAGRGRGVPLRRRRARRPAARLRRLSTPSLTPAGALRPPVGAGATGCPHAAPAAARHPARPGRSPVAGTDRSPPCRPTWSDATWSPDTVRRGAGRR